MSVKIEESWKQALSAEFSQPYFQNIVSFLKTETTAGKEIFPPGPKIFSAFNTTPLPEVKVVILGQDPYHGRGQANGLSFSVSTGVSAPPSLQNIFKELHQQNGVPIPKTGDLEPWARQGVLLLNATLTVEAHQANSHSKIGWHQFTDAVISKISEQGKNVVFMLWGKFAQSKAALIDGGQHLILKAAHPSPLSAHNGFFGCGHFTQTNNWLIAHGKKPIDWSLA